MYLSHLALTNFRNFSRLDIDVPEGILLLLGDNAQGKTSILEAVYAISTFTSFHAGTDRELINFLASQEPLTITRLVADFVRKQQSHRLEIRIIKDSNTFNGLSKVRKEIVLDGNKRKLTEVVGFFNAVLFLPQMLAIIEGAPSERRRFVNFTLSQAVPDYSARLSSYKKNIAQRNALLRQINERGGDPDQLIYWDEQIVADGANIIHARINALQEIEEIAAVIHNELTTGSERLRINYLPSYDPVPQSPDQFILDLDTPIDRHGYSIEEIAQGFLKTLSNNRSDEIVRGHTIFGPHRDDIQFLANSIDLGIYGSRGQIRTTMLSIKLAEIEWIHNKTGSWPILLLDEVLAELDSQRRLDLLTRLTDYNQVLLTTTDLDLFSPEFVKGAKHWYISGGRVKTAFPNETT